MSPVFSVFLVVVTVGSFGMQGLRIRRHGAAGVSRSTWMGLLVSVTLWAVYGISVSDWTITATNIPLVVVATLIMVAMVREGAAHRFDVPMAVGGTLAACAVVVPLVGPDAVGAAAATISVSRVMPQLVTAVRAPDVAGVSITTWLGNIANKVPWGIYGFLVADIWMTGASVLATALSLAIVLVVVVRRRGAAAPVEVPTEGIPAPAPPEWGSAIPSWRQERCWALARIPPTMASRTANAPSPSSCTPVEGSRRSAIPGPP